MATAAPPSAQAEPQVASVQWSQLQALATGCNTEYIAPQEMGIRLWKTGNELDEEIVKDPDHMLRMMQEGVPVLFYNTQWKEPAFERRMLKVDNRTEFFYILVDGSQQGGGQKDLRPHDPVTVRVNQVEEVIDGHQALEVCDANSIKDDHLNHESGVLMVFGDGTKSGWKDDIPPADRLLVFMAAPQQQLKSCINVVRDIVKENADTQVQANATKHAHGGHAAPSLPPDVRRTIDIGVKDLAQLFSAEPTDIVFELTITTEGHKTPASFECKVNHDTPYEHCLDKAAEASGVIPHRMTALDTARVAFVMGEAVGLRQLVSDLMPTVYTSRLWNFVKEYPVALHDKMLEEAGEDGCRRDEHGVPMDGWTKDPWDTSAPGLTPEAWMAHCKEMERKGVLSHTDTESLSWEAEKTLTTSIPEEQRLDEMLSQVDAGLENLAGQRNANQGAHHAFAAAQTTLLGMQQLLHLEKEYNRLANSLAQVAPDLKTPRFQLKGSGAQPDDPVNGTPRGALIPEPSNADVPSAASNVNGGPNPAGAGENSVPEPDLVTEQQPVPIQDPSVPKKDGPDLNDDAGKWPCSGSRKPGDQPDKERPGDRACVGGKCSVQ